MISLMISLKAVSDKHVSAAESKYGLMTHIKALGLVTVLSSV